MATYSAATGDAITVKLWQKTLSVEVLKDCYAMKFATTDDTGIIQIKDETKKSAGDKVTFGLRIQLQGQGVIGDGTLEGNEESLTVYTDAVVINQLRHAVRSGGKVTEQRVPFSVREEAKNGLKDWWTDRLDYSFFNQIAGNTAESHYVANNSNLNYTGLQAPISVDAAHRIDVNAGTADESLGSSNTFSLTVLDKALERARTYSPTGANGAQVGVPLRPVKVKGKSYYVCFLHDYQVTDMRTSTTSGQWLDIQKAAMTGGEIDDNPIFTGALGVYNNIVLHRDFRVPTGVNSSTPSTAVTTVRRAVLCGASAVAMAFGRDNSETKFSWTEELFDYKNQFGVKAGSIFGMKKAVFNSYDYADVVISSYAAAH